MLNMFEQDIGLLKNYVTKIQELENKVLQLQNSTNTLKRNEQDYLELDAVGFATKNILFAESDTVAADIDGKLLPFFLQTLGNKFQWLIVFMSL